MITCKWFARVLLVGAVGVLLLGLSVPAEAQEQAAEAAPTEAELDELEQTVRLTEEVTVTGSLIPREDLDSLSPVSVVEPEEITWAGTGRIEDLIQALPGVFADQNSTIANGATGTATVDLRDLAVRG